MTKQQKDIIIKFSLWFLSGLFLIIIGISNVFADTYDATQFNAQLYDNYGPNLGAVSTNFTNMSWRGTIPTMVANSSGAAWGISSPIVLLANHTYSMSVRIEGTYGGLLVLSTYNRIGVGQTLSSAVSSYQNNTYVNENYSKIVSGQPIIQFAFTPTINSNYIVFPFATNYSGNNQEFYLYNVVINDLGTSGVSETTINNSLNNQTNEINNSITNSENNLKSAINSTEQNIIDNQNQNTQSTNDTLNNQLGNKCTNLLNPTLTTSRSHRGITFTPTLNNDGIVESYTINGTRTSGTNAYVKIGNLSIESGTKVKVVSSNGIGVQLWDATNDSAIGNSSGVYYDSYTFTSSYSNVDIYIYTTSDSVSNGTFKVMISKDTTTYCTYGSYSSKLDDTNNAINNLDDTLKSDDIDDNNLSDAFEDFNEFLDDNSTITQLITLPITLYTAILNNLNGTCQPFNLGQLYGEDLILPCINISQYLGSALWSMIDIIISGFAVYSISKKMIKVFNNFSSLREGDVIDD